MAAQLFRFTLGEAAPCFTTATMADRVGLSLVWVGGPHFNTTMSAEEARAMANALYEAADASEKVLPVKPDATVTA